MGASRSLEKMCSCRAWPPSGAILPTQRDKDSIIDTAASRNPLRKQLMHEKTGGES